MSKTRPNDEFFYILFTGDPYPSEVLKPVEENHEPPKGWPRNPDACNEKA